MHRKSGVVKTCSTRVDQSCLAPQCKILGLPKGPIIISKGFLRDNHTHLYKGHDERVLQAALMQNLSENISLESDDLVTAWQHFDRNL